MASTTTALTTSGLHCRSCSMLIDMTLTDLDGVASSETDLATGSTVVVHDSDTVTTEDLIAAIRAAGYDAAPQS